MRLNALIALKLYQNGLAAGTSLPDSTGGLALPQTLKCTLRENVGYALISKRCLPIASLPRSNYTEILMQGSHGSGAQCDI